MQTVRADRFRRDSIQTTIVRKTLRRRAEKQVNAMVRARVSSTLRERRVAAPFVKARSSRRKPVTVLVCVCRQQWAKIARRMRVRMARVKVHAQRTRNVHRALCVPWVNA